MTVSTNRTVGAFTFVLHAHLPYVLSHGVWPHGMDWIFEAASESYLPLLTACSDLVEEGISPKLTLGLTPVLVEQLRDPSFVEAFDHYLRQRIQSAEENAQEFHQREEPLLERLADRWRDEFTTTRARFHDQYHRDIVGAFAELQEQGHIEIITGAATHGYLPLIGYDASVRAQIRQGVQSYQRHFGRTPKGCWLPECAYRPAYEWKSPIEGVGPQYPALRSGVEEVLSEEGVQYFFVDTHLLMGGVTKGVYLERFTALQTLWEQMQGSLKGEEAHFDYSPYRSYFCSGSYAGNAVSFFTRDEKTGLQVWSGEHGYPGDGNYLDFHKKHYPGGHRYWKVTSAKADLADKMAYYPDEVDARLDDNANHFAWLVETILSENPQDGSLPIITAPYDAELFGHWWYEGPRWIYKTIKRMQQNGKVRLMTAGEHLTAYPPSIGVSLPEGSWGQGGFHWIWLNDWTEWTWKEIYKAEETMRKLAESYAHSDNESLQRLLRQTARELLLLESSDWQFLISTWSARDYAEMRLQEHRDVFTRLAGMTRQYAATGNLPVEDWDFLLTCEKRDNLFPDVNPAWWRDRVAVT
ncbi:MAG: glycoside hydrolase family 57 protein [Armatimonadota bacterium]